MMETSSSHPTNLGTETALTALIGSAQRERLFDQAIAKIQQYRQFADNWDSDGSLRPSDQAVSFAERLVKFLRETPDVTAPFVAPVDAGVYVEWRLGKSNLYLEIDAGSVLTVIRENGSVAYSTEGSLADFDSEIDLIEQFHKQAK